ncbi:MAG: hypothetical protein V1875_03905 [Candidatus Altiarchaeota archaeon]
MATKTKRGGKTAAANKHVKSSEKAAKTGSKSLPKKPLKHEAKAAGKKIKCCSNCPDFEYCEEKAICCDYCDFYLNGKCTFGKKKGIPSVNQEIELPDYRGDDYGIDDYEAYEPVYE